MAGMEDRCVTCDRLLPTKRGVGRIFTNAAATNSVTMQKWSQQIERSALHSSAARSFDVQMFGGNGARV
jgi:hypothetical protein